MILIGIAGYAGAGKDTAAWYLKTTQGAQIYHFADPLKRACAAAFNIPIQAFSDPELKNVTDPYWKHSPRKIAQYVGTELFRTHYGEDFWTRRLQLELQMDKPTLAVVADVRFQNEVDWLAKEGGYLLHIFRSGFTGNVGIPGHASEAGFSASFLEEGGRYFRVNNDHTLEHLHSQIHLIYTKRVSK